MDGQLLRPDEDFIEAAKGYVCVRVTDMQAVDLNRYPFDFDLTLIVLLANADGTIYHRCGGRTHDDPLAWMSQKILVDVMRATLTEHASYQKNPRPPEMRPARTIYDDKLFARRMQPKRPDCIHCHQIHEAEVRGRQARGEFDRDSVWPLSRRPHQSSAH